MTAQNQIDPAPVFQRARGTLDITVQRAKGDVTRLQNLRQQGSFRSIFPRPQNDAVEAVIINTAGGVTGGDRFSTEVKAGKNAKISVTTQAAERIYGAADFNAGSIDTTLVADEGAQLYWLPQETILFDGARLRRRLKVELHPGARFLMVEPLVFGRAASGETVHFAHLDDRVSITSAQRPIYLDRINLDGDIAHHLARPAVANGARAMASVVLVDPNANLLLGPVRGLLPKTAGASMLSDTVLVVRILAPDSFVLRATLLQVLTVLTNNAVPKNWRL